MSGTVRGLGSACAKSPDGKLSIKFMAKWEMRSGERLPENSSCKLSRPIISYYHFVLKEIDCSISSLVSLPLHSHTHFKPRSLLASRYFFNQTFRFS